MILVGSRSISNLVSLGRQPRDTDFIGTYEEYTQRVKENERDIKRHYPLKSNKNVILYKNGDIEEWELAWPGSTGEKLLFILRAAPVDYLDLAYTLKMSHRYLKDSPHFLKTMEDIHKLRKAGAKIPTVLKGWFKEREKATYTYSHPKLNTDKSSFFDTGGVTYTYDHDSIHEAVKLGEKPAYTYFKEDEEEVLCSKDKFFSCSEEIRLNAVLEESIVLALERCLIPYDFAIPCKGAFLMALNKVCTSITSGWFREYAWENYDKVVDLFQEIFYLPLEKIDHKPLKCLFQEGIDNEVIIKIND